MTKLEVAKLVAVIIAAYPPNKFAPQAPAVYERMLEDLEYPAANAAVERLLATSKFPPTIAEVREAALALHVGEQRPGGDAWGSVLKAIRGAGAWRRPGVDFTFKDPLVLECVRAMGWSELCGSENQTADRARFIELYDQLAAQHRRKQLSESMPAMQRFRALQAAQQEQLPSGDRQTGEAKSIGAVLKLLPGGGS